MDRTLALAALILSPDGPRHAYPAGATALAGGQGELRDSTRGKRISVACGDDPGLIMVCRALLYR